MRARDAWLGRFVALVVRVTFSTMRIRRLGRDRVDRLRASGTPFVYAVWHGQQLLLLGAHQDERCTVLVSQSRDGGLLAGLLRAFGVGVVRGSTSRGAVSGARGLLRSIDRGQPPVLAVDGPRGPAGSVAPGAARIAAAREAVVVPVATACSGGLRLRSWDRAVLPAPLRRQVVIYGRPIAATDDVSGLIQDELTRLTQRAERLCG